MNRRPLILALFVAGACWARGVAVGDSLQQVLAEKGKPVGKVAVGDTLILRYPDLTVKLRAQSVVSVKAVVQAQPSPPAAQAAAAGAAEAPTAAAQVTKTRARIAALQDEERKAVERVIEIVNDPVEMLPLEPGMSLGDFNNGWFDASAEVPDFDNADVAQTQETARYLGRKHEFGTTRLNPGFAFRLADLAYNRQTRYFYKDLSVPKKKLSMEALQEINGLYRVIGRCNRDLTELGVTPSLDGS